jgi:hypothetical protein
MAHRKHIILFIGLTLAGLLFQVAVFLFMKVSRLEMWRLQSELENKELHINRLRREIKLGVLSQDIRQGMSLDQVQSVFGKPHVDRLIENRPNMRELSYYSDQIPLLPSYRNLHISGCSIVMVSGTVERCRWLIGTGL